MKWMFLVFLGGCTFVGERTYDEQIRDFDGDGVIGERFGGEDCVDDDPGVQRCDADGDGYRATAAGGDDCDDANPEIHPGLEYFADHDEDGFGDPEALQIGCFPPPGTVSDDGDCDDDNDAVHPGVQETCDALDRNCDGDPFAGADASQWFYDRDGDGFGQEIGDEAACSPPPGQVANGDDCDDDDDAVYPGAPEIWYDGVAQDCDASTSDYDQDGDGQDQVGSPTAGATDCDDVNALVGVGQVEACDAIDNDCDLLVDDEDLDAEQTGQLTWYLDADRDGSGNPLVTATYCPDGAPDGWVLYGDDCDDTRSTVSPGALEVCNGRDDDCNGDADDGAIDQFVYYEDSDGDGYGNLEQLGCAVPDVGYSAIGGDCNDADAQTWPGAPEVCGDAARQDCSVFSPYDCDSDGDEGVAWGGTDCDDENADVHVGGVEACDGLDNDCDDLLDGDDPDVDPQTFPDWYLDLDRDGFGIDNLVAAATCTPPANTASNRLDCDDTLGLVNPDATEVCNGRDDDCDLAVDEEATDVAVWYYDADGDGGGDPSITLLDQCIPPAGEPWVDNGDDCDDADVARGPLASELCDGIDNDCDLQIDDADPDVTLTAPIWYADTDGDGWGLTSLVVASCAQPPSYAALAGDCNDFEAAVGPGAQETCNAGIDDDCDGLADDADPDIGGTGTWYRDDDGDGYGDPAISTLQCQQPAGYVTNDGDCDDGDPSISPAALEVCDGGIDDDCNGLADDADLFALGDTLWYVDADQDGIGGGGAVFSCSPPADGVSTGGDCDDGDAAISPFSAEVCNGIDDDCDGLVDDGDPSTVGELWRRDADDDGYGGFELGLGCDLTGSGYVLISGDCNDGDPALHPGAIELCDGVDQDCDAAVDDDPIDPLPFLADADADGFGAGATVFACDAPTATVPDQGDPALVDCDDAQPEAWPGNPVEHCDGLDNDCDALADAADLDTPTSGDAAWVDADGDGFGAGSPLICTTPYSGPGLVAFAGDCDDAEVTVGPLALEVCDGRDNDCDTLVDDADTAFDRGVTWFADDDGDGFGQYLVSAETCGAAPAPGTWSTFAGDCDDTDALAWPNGPDDCTGGGTGEVCEPRAWFTDADGDGYGDPATLVSACAAPPGAVDNAFDCDDAVPGDVVSVLAFDAADVVSALGAGGCPLVVLAAGFDDALAYIVPPGTEASVVSEDPAWPGVLRQIGNDQIFELTDPASLSLGDVALEGTGGGELVLVNDAAAAVALVDVTLRGGGNSQGLFVNDGDALVAHVRIYDTDAGGAEGSALHVQSAGSLAAFDVFVQGALGASSVLLKPDGDDVSIDRLVVAESDRIRVQGGTGTVTLSRVEVYAALDDGLVVDGAGSVAVLDQLVIAQSTADGLVGNSGITLASHVIVAGAGEDGVDGAGITLTDAVVLGSDGYDLNGSGGSIVWDHARFDTSFGTVTGSAPVSGEPAWISYAPGEPWEMLDFHLAAGSPLIGAGSTGDDVGFHLAAEGWSDDLDGNGLPDGWERRWFAGTGVSVYDDPDLDGVPTIDELARGTAPVRADTDGDASMDGADFAPLDPGAQ